MAACTFNIDNNKHVSELQKVTRDDLYGSRRVQALGPDSKPLRRAGVPEEGNLYLVSGDVARTVRAGEQFTLAPVEVVDSATGQKKEVLPSSFKQAPEFRKATAEEVSLLEVASVYRLPGAQLSQGSLHLGTFNYRDGVERNDAAILANGHGTFLLVGKIKKPGFIGMEIDSQIIAEATASEEAAEATENFESLF
jgi:GTPase